MIFEIEKKQHVRDPYRARDRSQFRVSVYKLEKISPGVQGPNINELEGKS